MQSLDDNFNELRDRIKQGREMNFVSFEPIFYLVFHPSQTLEVKKRHRSWLGRLRKDGYNVTTFSIAKVIDEIFNKSKFRDLTLSGESSAGENLTLYGSSIENMILQEDPIHERLQAAIEEANTKAKGLVFVTDVEALHPFTRIGVIEAKLQNQCNVPLVIAYPGVRAGKSSLKFLGFYAEDGNYRSVHVGG
jgi:hypothetical protein